MKFCTTCCNTGHAKDSEYLDCIAPGCTAAETWTKFDRWLLQNGWPQSSIKDRAIYTHAIAMYEQEQLEKNDE